MSIRVLVCGDREWSDKGVIRDVIGKLVSQYGDEITIIHGAAWGADSIAAEVSINYFRLVTIAVPAQWDKYGNRAGPIRNKYMLEKGKPNLVLAFHPNIEASKGTKHMVEIAIKAEVPVIHIAGPETEVKFPDRLK